MYVPVSHTVECVLFHCCLVGLALQGTTVCCVADRICWHLDDLGGDLLYM